MTALISKPGITTSNVLSIPTDWSASWFKGFVANYLKGADVRNAIAGSGISISGTIASPYATISAGGSGAPFLAPVIVKTTPGGVTVFEVFNSTTDPVIEAYGPTAAGLIDITPDTGTFTGTLTGFSGTAPTVACRWRKIGPMVILVINVTAAVATGTSNATSFTMTGLPSIIQPATEIPNFPITFAFNNSALVTTDTWGQINPGSGTVTFYLSSTSASSWTAAGTKGLEGSTVIAYTLD
jgi:hypothetical protein